MIKLIRWISIAIQSTISLAFIILTVAFALQALFDFQLFNFIMYRQVSSFFFIVFGPGVASAIAFWEISGTVKLFSVLGPESFMFATIIGYLGIFFVNDELIQILSKFFLYAISLLFIWWYRKAFYLRMQLKSEL